MAMAVWLRGMNVHSLFHGECTGAREACIPQTGPGQAMGLISTGQRLFRLQPGQPFKGGVQGLVLLGKAEADEVLVAAVAVEG